jgi:hypothetical protein
MTAAKILSLIETVEPGDAARLDEIDCRVACFLQEMEYGAPYTKAFLRAFPQYTRSRDALKSIRPEGWTPATFKTDTAWYSEYRRGFQTSYDHVVLCLKAPTEELAELHAIIQAIAFESGETHG